jgi:drug/metabolite transporter (DMT)-like permease
LKAKLKGQGKHPLTVWRRALIYSLIFVVGYYPCVVLGLRCSTPAICALVMGIGPIVIALYGNWKERECSFRSLIFPSIVILIGLALINVPALNASETPSTYLIGLLGCLCALITWSWSVVAHARFLRSNRQVSSSDWATMNGVTTFIWVGLFILLTKDYCDQEKYLTWTPQLMMFLGGSAVLGVVCSWVGGFLWNKATLHLPVSLAGQLTIFETIFGLVFIYLLQQRLPPVMECIGMVLFLIAIVYGIRKFAVVEPELKKD